LLNTILGEKVAIVNTETADNKEQINGIKTLPHAQIIFIDTPGIHKPRQGRRGDEPALHLKALEEVDIVLFLW